MRFEELKAAPDGGESDSESEREAVRSRTSPPWRSIALAVALLVVGVVLLISGALRSAGVVSDGEEKGTPMIIVGSICFLPGFYIVRIAYYSWKGDYGYTYHDIPS